MYKTLTLRRRVSRLISQNNLIWLLLICQVLFLRCSSLLKHVVSVLGLILALLLLPMWGYAAGVLQVEAGNYHTCALKSNSSIACWGANHNGQATPPAGSFTQVEAGMYHTCALKSDNSIACWGNNERGQTTPPAGSFTQVAAGDIHTCALKSDGGISCWGGGTSNTGTNYEYGQATPPAGSFTQVAAGGLHTCALKSDNSIACWGNNTFPPPEGSFTQVAAGAHHTCALKSDGSIACWNNYNGQGIPPAGSFTQVAAGAYHTCALKSDNSIVCWGNNDYGQTTAPVGSFTQVSAGNFHTCALKSDGGIVCWGAGTSGTGTSIGAFPQYGQSIVPTDLAAPATPNTFTLSLTQTGNGTVTSTPVGINCGTDCTENYNLNTQVTLTATPTANAIFTGWSGDCSGTAASTTVTMSAAKNCTANFCAATAPIITTFAGIQGLDGSTGDGGPATNAQLSRPGALSVDSQDNLYVSEINSCRVRKITPDGSMITAAIGAGCGFSPDGTLATNALLGGPSVAINSSDVLYIADYYNHCIRRVKNGVIDTVAGICGQPGLGGDVGPALTTKLRWPRISIAPGGDIFIGGDEVRTIRRLKNPGTPGSVIELYAGTGPCCSNDDVVLPRLSAKFGVVSGIGFDANFDTSGSMYVADNLANRIRKIDAVTGNVSTLVGTVGCDWGYGNCLCENDDVEPALNSKVSEPEAAIPDAQGNVYILDSVNSRIRLIEKSSGMVKTVVGKCRARGYSGDGGHPAQAILNAPLGMVFDSKGNYYIADSENHVIRKVTVSACAVPVPRPTLSVQKIGNGTVTSLPTGISCGTDCTENYNQNTSVTLTANPVVGYMVDSWTGCTPSADKMTCQVTMDAAKNVNVTFKINTARLINLSANAKLPIIGGLGITGTGNLRLIFRGFAIESCVDPVIVLQEFPSGREVARNDNWQNGGSVSANISDLPNHLTLTNPTDAGLLIDLAAGYYTISLGSNGCNGQGLVGVDLIESASSSTAKLINLSANAPVPIIGGLGMSGSGNMQAMFRGFKVDACIDPNLLLQKYPSGENFASNDNWETDSNVTQVRALPSHLQLPTTVDSGLLRNLTPQYFTATLSTQSGCQGNGLFGLDIVQ